MIAKILFVVIAFSAVAIVALVLIQQSKGDAGSAFGGGGGGGSQSMFGSRGSANFLSRLTSILVAIFFTSSIGLAYYYTQEGNGYKGVPVEQEESVLDSLKSLDAEVPKVPDTSIPSSPIPSTETEAPKAELLEPNTPASGVEVPAVPSTK